MTPLGLRDRSCERAREGVSRRLDGELSELEGALLTAHLRRCASCRAFAADIEVVTTSLRSAPLAELESPVVVAPRRRVAPLRVRQVATAAAAIVAAVGVAGVADSLRSQQGAVTAPTISLANVAYDDVAEMRVLRRGEMLGNVVWNRDLRLPGDF
jgi:predicted anti-sigma-YlaC factor YlaD